MNGRIQTIYNLGNFVRAMCKDGVRDADDYRDWVEDHVQAMEELYEYRPNPGMPPITSMVKVFFHPRLDLVGLNYTQLAFKILHHDLHDFWSSALAASRGIIYNYDGELVALPMAKAFNDHEIPADRYPTGKFVASEKLDGESGICYWYKRRFRINTRGSFIYKTARIAQDMLNWYAEGNAWNRLQGLKALTLQFEIVHPETHKIVQYGDRKELVLIAAFRLDSLDDLDHTELSLLGERLGVPVAQKWEGNDLDGLRRHVKLDNVRNREGYVARFESGERVKFKHANFLARMREQKLSYRELMKRFLNNEHAQFVMGLPEEIEGDGKRMLTDLLAAKDMPTPKLQRAHLYGLVEQEQLNSTYKDYCGKFLRALAAP